MPASRKARRGLDLSSLKLAVLDALRDAGAFGATKREIVDAVSVVGQTSLVSVQRALTELRRDHDAQIECVGADRRWRLVAPFAMPLSAPDREDLIAVLVAQAILEPLADDELRARIGRLVEELDDRVRARESAEGLPNAGSVSAALTLGTRVDATVLRTVLTACRRKVLRIVYASPWKEPPPPPRNYTIEPWALRVHDGAAYLRAWSRDADAPRTFRVADIERVDEAEGDADDDRVRARVPPNAMLWIDGEPAFGIDRDRPGEAVIELRGAVARWVSKVTWHPEQKDRWIDGEVLERKLAYRSCRELARRVATVSDGIVRVEPAELRAEVAKLLKAGLRGLGEETAAEGAAASSRDRRADDLPEIMLRVRAGDRPGDRSASEADEMTNARAEKVGGS